MNEGRCNKCGNIVQKEGCPICNLLRDKIREIIREGYNYPEETTDKILALLPQPNKELLEACEEALKTLEFLKDYEPRPRSATNKLRQALAHALANKIPVEKYCECSCPACGDIHTKELEEPIKQPDFNHSGTGVYKSAKVVELPEEYRSTFNDKTNSKMIYSINQIIKYLKEKNGA